MATHCGLLRADEQGPQNEGAVPHREPEAAGRYTPMKIIEAWEETLHEYEKRFQTALDAVTRMRAPCQLLLDFLRRSKMQTTT